MSAPCSLLGESLAGLGQVGLVQKPMARDGALYLDFLRLSTHLLGMVKNK